MVTIPTYGPAREEVRPLPSPRIITQAPREAFGSGAGLAAVGDAASSISNDLAQLQDQQDMLKLAEERRILNEHTDAAIYDEKNGAATKLGKDAYGVPAQLATGIEGLRKQRVQVAANAQQARMLGELYDTRNAETQSWAKKHVLQQHQVHIETETDATIESSTQRGARGTGIDRELGLITGSVLERAGRKGWDKAKTDMEIYAARGELHRRRINMLFSEGKDEEAWTYYAGVKDELTDEIASKVEGGMKTSHLRRDVAEHVAIIFQADQPPKTLGEAVDRAQEIEDPSVRAATTEAVRERWHLSKEIEKEKRSSIVDSAMNDLKRSPGRRVQDISPETWGEMTLPEQTAMKKYAGGYAEVNDPQTVAEIAGLASSGKLAKMSAQDIQLKYTHLLTESGFSNVFTQWKSSMEKDPQKYIAFIKDNEQVLHDVRELGLGGIRKADTFETISTSPALSEKLWEYKSEIEKDVAAYHTKTGKNPDDKAMQEIFADVKKYYAKEVVREWWTGESRTDAKKVRLSEMSGDELKVAVIGDVPWAARSAWHKEFGKGLPFKEWENANRERVNLAYRAGLRGDSNAAIRKILKTGKE